MTLKNILEIKFCFKRNGEYKISSKKLSKIEDELKKQIENKTSFLDEYDPTLSDRIKYVLNDKYEINRCLLCNKQIIKIDNKFCSYKCNNNSEETKNKFREAYKKLTDKEKKDRNKKRTRTVIEKYGGYTLKSEELSSKMKKTMMKRYGVEHSFQIENSRNKAIKTWMLKYGTDNPFKSEIIKKKIKSILIKKYGTDNPALIDLEKNLIKSHITKIQRGLIIPDEFLCEYRKYRKLVNNTTSKNYKKHFNYINPQNFTRVTNGKDGFQLDHKFSVFEGFLHNVDIDVISHPCNLRMIHWKNNRDKGRTSSIELSELINNINNFKIND